MPDRHVVTAADRPDAARVPALTGLRGLSILFVLGFHLALPFAGRGGPVGVTVFFVLSGFLITSLLAGEWGRDGAIDLRAFYVRRARRLLPALVVAVGAVLLVAAAAGHAPAVAADSVLALTYVANWARADGDLMGMWNHAWSLAIEEQFYLLWPIAFLALLRMEAMTSGRLIGAIVALAAGSALLRGALVVAGAPDERIYFGSDTRAEALLVGAALALLVARRPAITVPRWVGPAALSALILLVWLPAGAEPWPGALYTLVGIASCGVIVAARRTDGGGVGLTWAPLVWLGERSYSLYLWHVPVILFLAGPLDEAAPLVRIAVPAVVSMALAAGSYTYVEQPFRRRRAPDEARVTVPARLVTDHSA